MCYFVALLFVSKNLISPTPRSNPRLTLLHFARHGSGDEVVLDLGIWTKLDHSSSLLNHLKFLDTVYFLEKRMLQLKVMFYSSFPIMHRYSFHPMEYPTRTQKSNWFPQSLIKVSF